jgi:cytochrome c-type biogenesis protein CcmF
MAQIGSFALLLALALSIYSFGIGLLALFRKDDTDWNRLGETARRAGVVVFAAVFLAALALVVSAFRDDFRIAYIFHHSNRDLPAPYKFATLWSGQGLPRILVSSTLRIRLRPRLRYKTDPASSLTLPSFLRACRSSSFLS